MSDASTRRLIENYVERAPTPMFLSGFFKSPPRNFHNTEKVEIDIIRDDEDVAIVLTDVTTGARLNESSLYTNKAFTPPIFDEAGAINAYKQMQRSAGVDPFQDPEFGRNALREAFDIFDKCARKISRAVELMASQVFQGGVITLINNAGTTLYNLDFQAKDTHNVTVTTTWAENGSSGSPIADLEALARVIRRDGKKNPTDLIFGSGALQRFLANADVKARLDNRNMSLGAIVPETRGEGATYQGRVWVGSYPFEMWSYEGYYKHPQTGVLTPYVAETNVIMLARDARLDLSFGTIPMIVQPDQRALPFLPPRISDGGRGIDLTTNAWISPDGKNVMVSCGTRPLTIPTAIDTFGCLTVEADS